MRVVHVVAFPAFTHYIGRNAEYHGFEDRNIGLGNPFDLGTREVKIAKFLQWARKRPSVLKKIKELPRDAILGCWCKPNDCHGDVIVKLWRELHATQRPVAPR